MGGYAALCGRDGAFGWARESGPGSFSVSLSGLKAGQTYMLDGRREIVTDVRGAWQGDTEEAPAFAAEKATGYVILCDEGRMTWEEAALQAAPRRQKIAPRENTEKEVVQKKEKVQYRTRLHGQSVDALPALQWPKGSEDLRACFEKGPPVCVLPLPWRFALVPGTKGQCLVGVLQKSGRIIKIAYAVRAKGGLLQPRGLQGYKYVRSESGEGYWLLEQSVR